MLGARFDGDYLNGSKYTLHRGQVLMRDASGFGSRYILVLSRGGLGEEHVLPALFGVVGLVQILGM